MWKVIPFDMKRIPYISKALSYGDYSCFLPACPEYGINRDLYFTNRLAIERKVTRLLIFIWAAITTRTKGH